MEARTPWRLLDERLANLEQRVQILETNTVLDPNKNIPENIVAWFEYHTYLHVGHFDMELRALPGVAYSKNAVRSACWRLMKEGKLYKAAHAIYRRTAYL